jgi:hypothetical protein
MMGTFLEETKFNDFSTWVAEEFKESIETIELDLKEQTLCIEVAEDVNPKEFADGITDTLYTRIDFFSTLNVNIYGNGQPKETAIVFPFNSDYDDLSESGSDRSEDV